MIAILQARLKSKRFPRKVLHKIYGKPLICHCIDSLKAVKQIDKIVIATTPDSYDDIQKVVSKYDVDIFTGSEENVLQRFYRCAYKYKQEYYIRATADNPILIARYIDEQINKHIEEAADYSVITGIPVGSGVEIFKFDALFKAYCEAKDKRYLEHVLPYLYDNPQKFKCLSILKNDLDGLSFTIDTKQDLKKLLPFFNIYKKWSLDYGY